jgi:hypothetical protein
MCLTSRKTGTVVWFANRARRKEGKKERKELKNNVDNLTFV